MTTDEALSVGSFRFTVSWYGVTDSGNSSIVRGLATSLMGLVRNCQVCGKEFLECPPFTRSSRIYCSRKCNQVAYRQRKKEETEE